MYAGSFVRVEWTFVSMFFLFIIFLSSALLTGILRLYAVRYNLIDQPGKRSSHQNATPRGGGVAFVLVFLIYLLFFLVGGADLVQSQLIYSLLIGGLGIALVGFWDDHGHIRARWRLLAHFTTASIAISFLPILPVISFVGFTVHLSGAWVLALIVGLVWMVNLYNFMDGSDGLASSEAIFVAAGAGIIMLSNGENDFSFLLLSFILSVGGFLIWNWPKAKIFMGDSGSGFLGVLLGLFILGGPKEPVMSMWSWLILLAVFLVDSTYTLIQRVFAGNRWYEAHRSHTYQIVLRRFGSHVKTLFSIQIVNVFWLFPLAFFASKYYEWGLLFFICAIIPLFIVAVFMRAGLEND